MYSHREMEREKNPMFFVMLWKIHWAQPIHISIQKRRNITWINVKTTWHFEEQINVWQKNWFFSTKHVNVGTSSKYWLATKYPRWFLLLKCYCDSQTLFLLGSRANCYEFVILAAFWVNIFQDWKNVAHKNEREPQALTAPCAIYTNRWNSHDDECSLSAGFATLYIFIILQNFCFVLFCTPRHWLIYDTVSTI